MKQRPAQLIKQIYFGLKFGESLFEFLIPDSTGWGTELSQFEALCRAVRPP